MPEERPRTTSPRPVIQVTYLTEKGEADTVRIELTGLTTIDRTDIAFVLRKAEQELRRLDASRLFNGRQ